MTRALPDTPQANEIATLAFDFDVTGQSLAMSSPDRMLVAIRQELLGTIDKCIDFAALGAESVHIPELKLDLGQFDNPPDWDQVRKRLQDDLFSALAPYLKHPQLQRDKAVRRQVRKLDAPATPKSLRKYLTGDENPSFAQLRTAIAGLSDQDLPDLIQHINQADHQSIKAHDIKTMRIALLAHIQQDHGKPHTPEAIAASVRLALTSREDPVKDTLVAALRGLSKDQLRSVINRLGLPKEVASSDRPSQIAKVMEALLSARAVEGSAPHKPKNKETVKAKNILARLDFRTLGKAVRSQIDERIDEIKNSDFIHTFISLIDENDVDRLLKETVSNKSNHLKTAITTLDKALHPDAAKRAALNAMMQRVPIDIAAIRDTKPNPQETPEIALARLFVMRGDSPKTAAQRITTLNNASNQTSDEFSPHNGNPNGAAAIVEPASITRHSEEGPTAHPDTRNDAMGTDTTPALGTPTQQTDIAPIADKVSKHAEDGARDRSAAMPDQPEAAPNPTPSGNPDHAKAPTKRGKAPGPVFPSNTATNENPKAPNARFSEEQAKATSTKTTSGTTAASSDAARLIENPKSPNTPASEKQTRTTPTKTTSSTITTSSDAARTIENPTTPNVSASEKRVTTTSKNTTSSTTTTSSDATRIIDQPRDGGKTQANAAPTDATASPKTTLDVKDPRRTKTGTKASEPVTGENSSTDQETASPKSLHPNTPFLVEEQEKRANAATEVPVTPVSAPKPSNRKTRKKAGTVPETRSHETPHPDNPMAAAENTALPNPATTPASKDVVKPPTRETLSETTARGSSPTDQATPSQEPPQPIATPEGSHATDGTASTRDRPSTSEPDTAFVRETTAKDGRPARSEIAQTAKSAEAPRMAQSDATPSQQNAATKHPNRSDIPEESVGTAEGKTDQDVVTAGSGEPLQNAKQDTPQAIGGTGLHDHNAKATDQSEDQKITPDANALEAEAESKFASKSPGAVGSNAANNTDGSTSQQDTSKNPIAKHGPTSAKNKSKGTPLSADLRNEENQPTRAQTEALLDQLLHDFLPDAQTDIKPLLGLIATILTGDTADQRHSQTTFWAAALQAASSTASKEPTSQQKIAETFANNLLETQQDRTRTLRNGLARLNYMAREPNDIGSTATAVLATMLAGHGVTTTAPAQPESTTNANLRHDTSVAGLILFHPYLKMLFDRLEIKRDRNAILPEALTRARSALDHLAYGQALPDLPADALQKCLLGLPPEAPSPDRRQLDRAAIDLIDSLVKSVITQWGKLGNTSPDGLRSAFVQRGGVLQCSNSERHVLTVNTGPYDMLLDGLPWSFNMVTLPWMPRPLMVDWRDQND